VEYSWFGLNSKGWHLFNIVLHGINAILAYRLLVLLGLSQLVAWATALLFAVHPVQSESVACVAGGVKFAHGLFCIIDADFAFKR